MRKLVSDPGTIVTRGSTFENRANLPPSVLADFERIYAGTRIGRQELEGELLEEAEVAVSPGRGFGETGEGYLRLALVENEHRLRQAVRQIGRCLRGEDSATEAS